jgi:glycerol-3-phosphate dehydrogenase
MALAEEALSRLIECGLVAGGKEIVDSIQMTPLGEVGERPYQRSGQIVCHCERVTVGEVTAACAAPVPAVDFDGLRRRTRALAGRCQGFYCHAELCNLTGWSAAP